MEDTRFSYDDDVVMQDQDPNETILEPEKNIITIIPLQIVLKILILSVTKDPPGLARVRRVCKEFLNLLSIKHHTQLTGKKLNLGKLDNAKTIKFHSDNTEVLPVPIRHITSLKIGKQEVRTIKDKLDRSLISFFQNLNYLACNSGSKSIGEMISWIFKKIKAFDEYHKGLDITYHIGQYHPFKIYQMLTRNERLYAIHKIVIDSYNNTILLTRLGNGTVEKPDPIWWIRL